MPKGKEQNKPKKGSKDEVNFELKLRFPVPRIPKWLGAANRLSADAAVYPRVDLDFPISATQVAVASGAVAQVVSLAPDVVVPNWAARCGNLFREYCVVGALLEITLVSSSSPAGFVVAFIDETLSTTPNAGSMFTPHIEVPIVNNPTGVTQIIRYKPGGSYTDLQWSPTASVVARQWLKFFASNANTLTGASTAATIIVRGTLALAFRGYANF